MKHGEFGWGIIVKVILALLAFILIFSITAKAQSGSTSTICGALQDTFDSAIFGPLKINAELC